MQSSAPLRIGVTAVLLLLLVALAVGDYWFSDDPLPAMVALDDDQSNDTADGPIAKKPAIDVEWFLDKQGLLMQKSDDITFLNQIVTDPGEMKAFVLLQEGDRIGLLTWVDGPRVKEQFAALKQALLPAFSTEVQDLQDVTLQEQGKPVRNVLSFTDPALSEEMLMFVRVRERLYEFHINQSHKLALIPVLEALTQQ